MKKTTSTWSNITDEDIAKADSEIDMGGELDDFGGVLQSCQSQTSFMGDGEPGSGNFGHEGRPREVGGNGEGGDEKKGKRREKPLQLKRIRGRIKIEQDITAKFGDQKFLLSKGTKIDNIKVFAGKGDVRVTKF